MFFKNTSKLTVHAPAKVNLHLAVKDRRQDGFHNLESVFVAVDFGDTLHFKPVSDKNSVKITMKGLDFPLSLEKNIIFRALSLFREKTGFTQGLSIVVEKRIPVGGGLGGGSSDAAASLLALNKIAGFPLTRDALFKAAGALGSDVPFFIHETAAALVTGRGECIEPVECPRCFFVLVNPGFSSDTAAAFQLLDECRGNATEMRTGTDLGLLRNLFEKSDYSCFCNDFLMVFRGAEKAAYNDIIFRLRELGAVFSSLSGAGSTCFGIFKERDRAEKAAAALRGICTAPHK